MFENPPIVVESNIHDLIEPENLFQQIVELEDRIHQQSLIIKDQQYIINYLKAHNDSLENMVQSISKRCPGG